MSTKKMINNWSFY